MIRIEIQNRKMVSIDDRPMPSGPATVVMSIPQDVDDLLDDCKEANLKIVLGDSLDDLDEVPSDVVALVERLQKAMEPEREMDAFDEQYERARANGWED
jgi:hypothetical protein